MHRLIIAIELCMTSYVLIVSHINYDLQFRLKLL